MTLDFHDPENNYNGCSRCHDHSHSSFSGGMCRYHTSKWERFWKVNPDALRQYRATGVFVRPKRRRSTAICVNEGTIVLVREKGQSRFSLPGGNIEHGEYSMSAAVREVGEELGLQADACLYLFDFESATTLHSVFMIEYQNNLHLSREISDFTRWAGDTDISVRSTARAILELYRLRKPSSAVH